MIEKCFETDPRLDHRRSVGIALKKAASLIAGERDFFIHHTLGSEPNQGIDPRGQIMIPGGMDPLGGVDGEPVLAFG